MPATLSEKKIHKIGRIDQIIREYFERQVTFSELPAKDCMDMFIAKGIFLEDYKNGLPIRRLLRELDAVNKLHLLKHCTVVEKQSIEAGILNAHHNNVDNRVENVHS